MTQDTKSTGNGAEKPFTVAIFCGSKPGQNKAFMDAATTMAEVCHENGWNVVYGGGTTGIMGQIARTLVSLSGPQAVHGIIPTALLVSEQENMDAEAVTAYGRMTEVPDMHTRKRLMAQEANAFIALPGGYGTAEELFEVVTWNQLGIHDCPIILLNTEGFYTGLIEWISTATREGFVAESCKEVLKVAEKPEDVPDMIRKYKPAEGRFNLSWGKE